MRLSKAKGFSMEPEQGVLSLYFDSFSPPNAKRSKIKTFLKVSLVSLTFRLRTVFYFFEKMTVISLCWFTMKKWDLCKCFCAFNNFSNKSCCKLFCGINCSVATFKTAVLQWFFSNKHTLQLFLESTADSFLDMWIVSSAAVK